MENYYHTLGLEDSADLRTIKSAFKKLAVKYHPDKNPNNKQAEENFKRVNEAYQTLSNPQLKAAYDLLLINYKYQVELEKQRRTFHNVSRQHQTYTTTSATPRSNKAHYANRGEEQKKGIIWALGILGSVAVVVVAFLGILSYIRHLEFEEMEARKQAFLDRINNNLSADSIRILLREVDTKLDGDASTIDALNFRNLILSKTKQQAHTSFNNQAYNKALEYYRLWLDYAPSDLVLLNTRISLCYKNLGDFSTAKKMFQQMIANDQSSIFAHHELGKIEERKMGNLEKALEHYENASELIINDYIEQYGETFPLFMDPTRLPEIQYEIYVEKGELYFKVENYKQAIIACNWASSIRPQKGKPYYFKGLAEYASGNTKTACEDFQKSADLGEELARKWMTENTCL